MHKYKEIFTLMESIKIKVAKYILEAAALCRHGKPFSLAWVELPVPSNLEEAFFPVELKVVRTYKDKVRKDGVPRDRYLKIRVTTCKLLGAELVSRQNSRLFFYGSAVRF